MASQELASGGTPFAENLLDRVKNPEVRRLYEDAERLIETHNDSVFDPATKIVFFDFVRKLQLMGGTTPEALRQLSYETISKALPEFDGIRPELLAKQIAGVFRAVEPKSEQRTTYVSSKKAARMTPRELVEVFDPEDPDNDVGKHLRERARDGAFLYFDENGVLDRATSFSMLDEIIKGYPPRESYNGIRLLKVGDRPDNMVDENPLYPGRALRPDGTCDQTNRSWAGVPLETRQLVRLAVETGELRVAAEGGIDRAHDVMSIALGSRGFDELKVRYQKAFTKYNEGKRRGDLPRLKVELKRDRPRTGNPLAGGKPVQWAK